MKRGLKQKLYFFLVMALVFFTGKAALAEPPWDWVCQMEVDGCVCETNYQENIKVLISEGDDCEFDCDNSNEDDWVVVRGVPFERLEITVDDYVEISAHICRDLEIKACEVNEISVIPTGKRDDPTSADVSGNQGKSGQGRF